MWLLSTDRAELHYFRSAEEAARAGFAILSHFWDGHEQSFQETQAICARCKVDGMWNPRDLSSYKIRESCKLAERLGHDWIWNDTCCIDKSSSSELSEAINSMWTYYSLAEVCLAYLGDQSSEDFDNLVGKADRADRSLYYSPTRAFGKWATRGWTLQELIAPNDVLFLSKEWMIKGNKHELADVLQKETKIPTAALTRQADIYSFSVAERMSWAAERRTTRVEDEAYSLFGIFNVHLPPLYGEGRNAFRRLQEEIMKNTIDTSLFAWDVVPHYDPKSESYGDYLFAPSVSCFITRGYYPASFDPETVLNMLQVKMHMQSGTRSSENIATLPVFTTTPYGVCAHLPIIDFGSPNCLIAILSATRTIHNSYAQDPQVLVGLVLRPCTVGADPLRPLYYTGGFDSERDNRMRRLVDIPLRWHGNLSREWKFMGCKEVHIIPAPRHVNLSLHATGRSQLVSYHRSTPFRIPQRCLRALEDQGLRVQWSASTSWKRDSAVLDWQDDYQSATLILPYATNGDFYSPTDTDLYLSFGRCFKHPPNLTTHSLGLAWLSIHTYTTETITHNCTTDHVDGGWPHLTKKWVFKHRSPEDHEDYWYYTVSLSPCVANPDTTYVIHLAATKQSPGSLSELKRYKIVPSMSCFWDAVMEGFSQQREINRLPGEQVHELD